MTDETPGTAPAKKAPAKKAPAKKAAKAPAKKAPAKKAPAKKAPAKKATKAPAKKAPAKKASAKKAAADTVATPRALILNRLQELEERIAAEGTTPPPRRVTPAPVEAEAATPPAEPVEPAAPAAPEPAPVAVAADELAEPAAPAPVETPVKKAPAKPKADKPVKAPKTVAVVDEPAKPKADPKPPVRAAEPTRVVPVPVAGSSAVRLNRVLAGLVVLLLAVAAGLGAAAAVKDRPSTWSSQSVVSITSPTSPGPDSESTVVDRVLKRVHSAGFAGLTAASAGVRSSELRDYADARRDGAGKVVVEVRAKTADGATKLAESAGRQLLLTLATDQAVVSDSDRRVTGTVQTPATKAVHEKPTDRQAWLAGGLAALAVLLVGVVIVVLMTTRKPTA
jgi:hypothetical protein